MKLATAVTSALVVAAIGLTSLPGAAQERNGGRQRGGGRATSGEPAQRNDGPRQAAARQGAREASAQARQAAPPPAAAPRQYSGPPPSARAAQAAPRERSYGAPQAAPRTSASAPPAAQPRGTDPRAYAAAPAPSRRAVTRESYYGSYSAGTGSRGYYNGKHYVAPPPHYGHGSHWYARPYHGHVYVRPYAWVPYRPYYFATPYYAFRPWFSIGFGLSIGYPVPYPYAYLGTYRPRVYGDYDNAYSYNVTPSVSVYGGVSFDIQPSDADVWVDGDYVGTVGTFTPFGEPLTLTPGQHRIVVQREGFRPMEWDVTIEPGQVIPYRGTMQRY